MLKFYYLIYSPVDNVVWVYQYIDNLPMGQCWYHLLQSRETQILAWPFHLLGDGQMNERKKRLSGQATEQQHTLTITIWKPSQRAQAQNPANFYPNLSHQSYRFLATALWLLKDLSVLGEKAQTKHILIFYTMLNRNSS